MGMVRVGTADKGMQAFELVDQSLLKQEIKGTIDGSALTHEHMPDGEYAFNPGITRR